MRAFFQSIHHFFTHFFRKTLRQKQPSTPLQRKANSSAVQASAHSSAQAPPELKRLVYRATCQLPKNQRVHASRIGALLRQTDPNFSYERYKFTKLIDLLQSLPELVSLEKVVPQSDQSNRQLAPIYYVRTVTDTTTLFTDCLTSFKAAPFEIASLEQSSLEKPSSNSTPEWVHWHSLSEAISKRLPDFSPQQYGFESLKDLLESHSDLIVFKADSPDYLRLAHPSGSFTQTAAKPSSKTTLKWPQRRNNSSSSLPHSALPNHGNRTDHRPESLMKFAGISMEILNQKVSELAAITLPEPWYFGPKPPEDFAYPILKSYLRYTFVRLQYENKVLTSNNQRYCAFNTGLLDTLLRPIYALLSHSQNRSPDHSQHLSSQRTLSFCIAGEDYVGKTLVAEFAQLPVAANYFENSDKAFYHLSAGKPTVDWQHVVKDNMARLPLPFLERYAPAGFTPRSTQGMSTPEFYAYKRSFIAALNAAPADYQNIVSRLEEALEKTLRRTQINYTTAVPTYYPKINSVDLMLPMCLVHGHTVDLALVVRREPSGKYIGHTILTLRQAYNNARLICKLTNHWLPRAITLSQNS